MLLLEERENLEYLKINIKYAIAITITAEMNIPKLS